jgi:hypothetical protein
MMFQLQRSIAGLAALCVFTATACRTSPSHGSGVGKHLRAEDLTLVDAQGKPWCVLGSTAAFDTPGIELRDRDGGLAMRLGLLAVPADSTPGTAEFWGQPGAVVPSLHLESPTGDGYVTAYAVEHGAVLHLTQDFGATLSLMVNKDEAAIHFVPVSQDNDDSSEESSAVARLVLRGETMWLEIRSKDGELRVVDLSALVASQVTPSANAED